MSSLGLSLVGFIEKSDDAIYHLTTVCVPKPGETDADHRAFWDAAKYQLGKPFPRAGHPEILDLKDETGYITSLLTNSQIMADVNAYLAGGASLKLIELEPLLAWQHVIDQDRSSSHCNKLPRNPTASDLLPICLPMSYSNDSIQTSFIDNSAVIRSRSLNLGMRAKGNVHPGIIGVTIGWSLPLVHVVRFEDRCYLHNGYHRAFGARLAGATHAPCIFRDVTSADDVGAGNGNFGFPLLTSNNPPTLAHFSLHRAANVQLRQASRIIVVNWSEHVVPEE